MRISKGITGWGPFEPMLVDFIRALLKYNFDSYWVQALIII